MADTVASKKNPFAALDNDDDLDGAINVPDNMRASKNPNKGGNPKKQKKKDDRKQGKSKPHGGHHKPHDDPKVIFGPVPDDQEDDEGETPVEPEPRGEYVPYDQYVGNLVVGTTKAGRKVTENDNVIMPLKDDDDEVVNHGKKGKKNKEHKNQSANVIEIATMDLGGPTSDFNGDRNNRRNFNDKNFGGRGRGNNNRDDRDGGKSSGRGRGNRDGGNFSGRGRGNRDHREGGRGRGGREGGRGPYNKDRGSGKGRGLKISSEEEFPSLGKA